MKLSLASLFLCAVVIVAAISVRQIGQLSENAIAPPTIAELGEPLDRELLLGALLLHIISPKTTSDTKAAAHEIDTVLDLLNDRCGISRWDIEMENQSLFIGRKFFVETSIALSDAPIESLGAHELLHKELYDGIGGRLRESLQVSPEAWSIEARKLLGLIAAVIENAEVSLKRESMRGIRRILEERGLPTLTIGTTIARASRAFSQSDCLRQSLQMIQQQNPASNIGLIAAIGTEFDEVYARLQQERAAESTDRKLLEFPTADSAVLRSGERKVAAIGWAYAAAVLILCLPILIRVDSMAKPHSGAQSIRIQQFPWRMTLALCALSALTVYAIEVGANAPRYAKLFSRSDGSCTMPLLALASLGGAWSWVLVHEPRGHRTGVKSTLQSFGASSIVALIAVVSIAALTTLMPFGTYSLAKRARLTIDAEIVASHGIAACVMICLIWILARPPLTPRRAILALLFLLYCAFEVQRARLGNGVLSKTLAVLLADALCVILAIGLLGSILLRLAGRRARSMLDAVSPLVLLFLALALAFAAFSTPSQAPGFIGGRIVWATVVTAPFQWPPGWVQVPNTLIGANEIPATPLMLLGTITFVLLLLALTILRASERSACAAARAAITTALAILASAALCMAMISWKDSIALEREISAMMLEVLGPR